jgi:hypothetical protein
VNNKLKKTWEKAVVTNFEVISWNLPGGLEKTMNNLRMASPQAKI